MKTPSTVLPFEEAPFGEKVRRLRQASGRSIRQAAKLMEVSSSYLADVEYGRRMPSQRIISKLAELFRVPEAKIAGMDPRTEIREIVALATENDEARELFSYLVREVTAGHLQPAKFKRLVKKAIS